MHDPLTQAFVLNIPLPWKHLKFGGLSPGKEWAKYHLATIWHNDPCRGPGGDDSCGWFMRAHHGSPKVLEEIVRRLEYDWDRVFKSDSGTVYLCGLFDPDGGYPHLSVSAITLNVMMTAANAHFACGGRTNWKHSRKFMQKHLFDILFFAENPADSLFDSITRKFEIGCQEKHDARAREARIRSMAACVYGWILRTERPWYRHPRWHVHHWRLQIPLWQTFYRWAFERCCKCGGRFGWGESVVGDWAGTRIWHDNCDQDAAIRIANQTPKTEG